MLLFTAAGCGPRRVGFPAEKLNGSMNITVNDTDHISGVFSVRPELAEFIIYLYTTGADPLGSIRVQKREIIKNTTSFNEDFLSFFKYWAYIFNARDTKEGSTCKVKGVTIIYKSFKEKYPRQVEVQAGDTQMEIGIQYGN
ncbi:MAG: hypothetical protein U9R36_04955 [Elusimicrobiota bacterium]|nr:hypothetical protein [Elusimicrobiota bacterium]